ncbi:MAG: hypothetical protein COB37_03435 [Kordiimonadales bacterium]|nr:MAG: hypothetical protein COB37_03435 [Kordiimonadales bacterium]
MTNTEANSNTVRAAARDLIFVLGTLFTVKAVLLSFDGLWTYAGPVALIASLGVATLCLRAANENWADIGLKRPKSLVRTLLWALAIMVITIVLGQLVEGLMSSSGLVENSDAMEIDARYRDRFSNIPGNFPVYIYWVTIAWVIGGFTEELLFRGILLSRFEKLFSKAPFAIGIAIILQAILFGQQHLYYQGIGGALATGSIALVSGIFYVFLKRNIWPLTLSHGLANTLGLTLLYLS